MPTLSKCLLSRFWRDERGVVNSAEMVFVLTILVIGSLVGLAALRDAIVSELGDTGMAVGEIDQSYEYDEIDVSLQFGAPGNVITVNATVAGSDFADAADFCEQDADACIVISPTGDTILQEGDDAPTGEGG